MSKTKIDWCDSSINICWRCFNHCEYCYARKEAKRRAKYLGIKRGYSQQMIRAMELLKSDIFPDWERIFDDNCKTKKPKRIFMDSMSDIAYWETEWMEKVLNKIKQYQWHTFLFLTKFPKIYNQYEFPENCWLGVTLVGKENISNLNKIATKTPYNFISIEPISENMPILDLLYYPDWVIVGAETNNRKGKIIPKYEWIENIVNQCKPYKIPVFLKDNLKSVWGSNLIQEFPE